MRLTGRTTPDRDGLEACEKATAAGFPAAVRGLLIHHNFAGNTRAAEYFAEFVRCRPWFAPRRGNPALRLTQKGER